MNRVSSCFSKVIHVTEHAKKRMYERDISEDLLFDLVETGELKFKDSKHGWIAKFYENRNDNLICAAVLIEQTIIIKTVMYHFSFEE